MGYKKLEYIEATGTQYIDSGFIPTSNTKIVFKFSEKGTENGIWFGAYPSNGDWHTRSFGLVHNHVASKQFWMHFCSNTSSSMSEIIYSSVITLSADGLYLNNRKLCNTSKTTFTADNTMYIFNGHGNSTNHQPMTGRIHYFKIFEGNVLVRDFNPALDENGTPCFFDEVSQTYFYNKGEGDFIAGDPIEKNLLTESQLNLNNWMKNQDSFPVFQNAYFEKVNTISFRGTNGSERLYIPVTVQKSNDYVFAFRMTSPSGFNIYSTSTVDAFAFVRGSEPTGIGGGISDENLITLSNVTNTSSENLKKYELFFNSGNNTTVYLAIDFGKIQDNTTVSLIYSDISLNKLSQYEQRYLIRSNHSLYTIVDGTLTALQETIVESSLFSSKGFDELPDSSLLLGLWNPEILYWQSSTEYGLPTMTATMNATPLPQAIVTNPIDMSHPTIKGIQRATVSCTGNPLFACSFDDGATWKVHNGSEWADMVDSVGMTKTVLEEITTEQWSQVIEGLSSFKLWFILNTTEDTVTNVVIDYLNEGE